ncbi:hypothetical protein OVY01_07420 [Robbsia sp. Bb-Pol-6]|uniref:Type III secretion protein HrpB2 n=1 Tax=Robbsia betulipollinis TaxID=2981849 RepID=A0ABT3ZM88_9BURK|nr:hypothetical protein [Robbsia betulipollinis]MCY0387065.1 hypothetical protein [Robbsia betulipollinis]
MITFDSAVSRISGIDPVGAASSLSSASSASSAAVSGANAMQGALPAANGVGAAGETGGVGGASVAGGTNAPTPASAESTERFRQMLDHATLTVQSGASVSQHPSAISTIVDGQDAAFSKALASAEAFQQNAGTMDMREFTAQTIRMQFEMADAMTKIQLGVGFAQGGKGAVQTLMKNQ